MNIFFLLFFIFLGAVGLYYQADAGVFVGLGLIPWQVIRMKLSKKINLTAIIICGLVGIGYFVYIKDWVFLILFIFIILYDYWGHLRLDIDTDPEQVEE
ncbi:MAG: hypothetical protein ACOCRZ_03820 [Halothermotrichaceae bacterium]